jgi:hypothetical protein
MIGRAGELESGMNEYGCSDVNGFRAKDNEWTISGGHEGLGEVCNKVIMQLASLMAWMQFYSAGYSWL